MNDFTLALIKPDGTSKQLTGKIIDVILENNFEIKGMKMLTLTREKAEAFYQVHRGREFFNPLVAFMCSAPIVVMALKKENAVHEYRTLIGATDSQKAEEGTIRRRFGENNRRNAVHGSDSDENAKKEIAFFFSQYEIM